jgi:hypothetical protein
MQQLSWSLSRWETQANNILKLRNLSGEYYAWVPTSRIIVLYINLSIQLIQHEEIKIMSWMIVVVCVLGDR